ncbi:MAG: hypothetical protein WDZ40_03785 [Candidatus Spechtbacterales bacterium]
MWYFCFSSLEGEKMSKTRYIGSFVVIQEHTDVDSAEDKIALTKKILHNVCLVEAVSEEEALGIIYMGIHAAYPTSEGWSDHNVVIGVLDELLYRATLLND